MKIKSHTSRFVVIWDIEEERIISPREISKPIYDMKTFPAFSSIKYFYPSGRHTSLCTKGQRMRTLKLKGNVVYPKQCQFIQCYTYRCGRYVANVVVGKLDSTGPGKPHLIVSKMLEATNSSTIAIVVRDALRKTQYIERMVVQTFDEKQAVAITEANAAFSCSSIIADLAYVKSNFGNLLGAITVLEARDLPLVKAVKIMWGIEETLNQASGSVGNSHRRQI
uniref:Uncharacterized protein n=1 Tax=Timema cristinae TaxID=61476 RepID=A0A7R9D8Y5_TIMCR|nr:unnamed protein product [Timema cristinae]